MEKNTILDFELFKLVIIKNKFLSNYIFKHHVFDIHQQIKRNTPSNKKVLINKGREISSSLWKMIIYGWSDHFMPEFDRLANLDVSSIYAEYNGNDYSDVLSVSHFIKEASSTNNHRLLSFLFSFYLAPSNTKLYDFIVKCKSLADATNRDSQPIKDDLFINISSNEWSTYYGSRNKQELITFIGLVEPLKLIRDYDWPAIMSLAIKLDCKDTQQLARDNLKEFHLQFKMIFSTDCLEMIDFYIDHSSANPFTLQELYSNAAINGHLEAILYIYSKHPNIPPSPMLLQKAHLSIFQSFFVEPVDDQVQKMLEGWDMEWIMRELPDNVLSNQTILDAMLKLPRIKFQWDSRLISKMYMNKRSIVLENYPSTNNQITNYCDLLKEVAIRGDLDEIKHTAATYPQSRIGHANGLPTTLDFPTIDFQYFCENDRINPTFSDNLIDIAIKKNRFNIIHYILGSKPPIFNSLNKKIDVDALFSTTSSLPLIKLLVDHKYVFLSSEMFKKCCEQGQLEIFKYMVDELYLLPDDRVFFYAITGGNWELVKLVSGFLSSKLYEISANEINQSLINIKIQNPTHDSKDSLKISKYLIQRYITQYSDPTTKLDSTEFLFQSQEEAYKILWIGIPENKEMNRWEIKVKVKPTCILGLGEILPSFSKFSFPESLYYNDYSYSNECELKQSKLWTYSYIEKIKNVKQENKDSEE
ncbi:hypothetical protein DFA_09544 [Cavenderia fasciculata]|uniref:Ankyrin repeat-containing protein n=1 Tax=Cavenderia fasciculata TaxID=261658 RepID=F4Q7X5_CACFS|nr:uncharacterized protein DFA_09544 [Cavenderia fasciculata]EGG15875.1 hypothetical protein DFA_09544 [Cavenderia fasciculata]|eukprot:XP_004352200.1 hypothetical protein DFA_09544 [Cavenderia fasciculata]